MCCDGGGGGGGGGGGSGGAGFDEVQQWEQDNTSYDMLLYNSFTGIYTQIYTQW